MPSSAKVKQILKEMGSGLVRKGPGGEHNVRGGEKCELSNPEAEFAGTVSEKKKKNKESAVLLPTLKGEGGGWKINRRIIRVFKSKDGSTADGD